jgi:hypothetical protein
MIPLGKNGVEHKTEENLKWRKFNAQIIDMGTMKLNVI